ncbi:hypothetical protein NX059_008367 [Plenodomus lindquistii]|nr:hypothetical protein NX059_008367 [Plenodomus lindquistii]
MAMHLASMVHGSVRERDAFQHTQHTGYFQHAPPRPYQQPHLQQHQSHAQPQRHLQQQQQQQHQQAEYHAQLQRQRPQSPPSPPAEEQKPSLPSISSLLEFAGGEKAASDRASQSPQSQHRQSTSPQPRQAPHRPAGAMQQPPQPHMSRPEQQSTHVSASTAMANPRMTLPPTPPMHPDVAHDGTQSPSAASTHSTASAAYFGASLNNMEPHHQRQSLSMPSMKRDSIPSHSMSPYSASVYGQSPYTSSPGGASSTSFYSPEQHAYNRVGMYGQQPLPSNFQPQTMPLPVAVPNSAANSSNPWQHHHYISTSSQSQFPQSQDRYICSTCNKAFSRPSSLRIHSHSHTGEKPYKCPQPNCGKAFSVRSNMKRHERGCHAATSTTLTT